MPVGGPSAWYAALIAALTAGFTAVVAFLPNLLGAIVILLIGWGVGKLIQGLLVRGLDAVHFNRMTEQAGINDSLERANVKRSPSQILGIIAYWFILLVALNAAINVLGIPALTALMSTLILYLPRVFAALLIVIVGAVAASFLGRLTTTSATTSGITYGSLLGNLVQGAVIFFAFAMALDVLGLSFPFLATLFAIVLGAIGLAAAVAFGFGGREYASDILAGRELQSIFHRGDRIMADDLSGTITDMRPTVTVVRTDRGEVSIQNRELMHRHATRPGTMGGEGGGPTQRAA